MVKWEREDVEGTELDVLQGPFSSQMYSDSEWGEIANIDSP